MLVRLEKRDKVTPKTQAHGTVEGMMNPEPETFRNEKRKCLPPILALLSGSRQKGAKTEDEWENK
jgi:hypothetical protein